MQRQDLKKIQSYPPLTEYGHPVNIAFIPLVGNPQPNWPISTGIISQTTEMRALQENRLAALGEQLAIWLSEVLGLLRTYNENAIHPIISILEPYMDTIPELDLHIPPKSSREVFIEITREGRARPEAFFDESLLDNIDEE